MMPKEDYHSILLELLKATDYHPPHLPCHSSVQNFVMEHFAQQHEWEPEDRARAIKISEPISVGVARCYPHATPEAQTAFSLHNCYILFIDDRMRAEGPPLGDFATQLLSSQPQSHPILRSYVKALLDMQAYVGPYAASMTLSAANNFISGIAFERLYDGKVHPPKGAVAFPPYLRIITGISEPTAHYIFPQHKFPEEEYLHIYLPCIPDLVDYVNWVNDITSFYKESIVGDERLNYVCNFAHTRDISYAKALKLITQEVCERVQRIRYVLRKSPGLMEVVEDFFKAYMAFHLEQPRYRLREVL